jgi:invasion protein IalB
MKRIAGIGILSASTRAGRYRLLATVSLGLTMATTVMRVDAQELVPFGDVPAIEHFTEVEFAARGRKPDRPLTYARWRRVCFKATQDAQSKLVCRTTINGTWDTGQTALRLDLIEREGDPVSRLQIFVPPGAFLQPGVRLSVDQGPPLQIPYVLCLTNGCVAASVASAGFIHDLETGRLLDLETVNSNRLSMTNSIPLMEFAEVHRGAPSQVFEQRLEGDWDQMGR